jgi:hypothetical protein
LSAMTAAEANRAQKANVVSANLVFIARSPNSLVPAEMPDRDKDAAPRGRLYLYVSVLMARITRKAPISNSARQSTPRVGIRRYRIAKTFPTVNGSVHRMQATLASWSTGSWTRAWQNGVWSP